MRTRNMREIIEFYSVKDGITEDGIPIKDMPIKELSVWAEIPKFNLHEIKDQITKVGFRREETIFRIRFLQDREIKTDWIIHWRNKKYNIVDIETDYQKRDINTITAKVIE